jgi:diaminopimelate epimerase
MHGLGNDFVVIDLVTQRFNLQTRHVKFLADRHLGIGCDQLLVVETPQNPLVDFRYRIFNADGSEVEQCGNGARCFALFVKDKQLTGKDHIVVETSAGIIELNITADKQVEVNMGIPELDPARIPFLAKQQQLSYSLPLGKETLEIGAVSMGNPHAIVRVDDIDQAPLARLGPLIEAHAQFPNRVNAGFMEIVNRQQIKLRVFERGVGETRACGTGACAAVVYARLKGWLDSQVEVALAGGILKIEWQGEGQAVRMTGPAVSVFEGKIHL